MKHIKTYEITDQSDEYEDEDLIYYGEYLESKVELHQNQSGYCDWRYDDFNQNKVKYFFIFQKENMNNPQHDINKLIKYAKDRKIKIVVESSTNYSKNFYVDVILYFSKKYVRKQVNFLKDLDKYNL